MAAENIVAAAPLLRLPSELHSRIIAHLSIFDLRNVRLINRYFSSLPGTRPSHAQLLAAETSAYALSHGLLACVVCLKLRPKDAFPITFIPLRQIRPGETEESSRFCHECGMREFDGSDDDWNKFCRGSRWRVGGLQGKRFARCLQCESCQEWTREQFPYCSVGQGYAFCVEHHRSDCHRCGDYGIMVGSDLA